ncbi:MAG: hypothetical protein ACFCVE_00030 [Phycisphaerae bacterium]
MWHLAHEVLRPRPVLPDASAVFSARRLGELAVLVILAGGTYGIVMGTFAGFTGERFWQLVYSGLKVPMLLGVTFVIALPSFFVLNTLLGVRSDFGRVLAGLIETQAATALLLVSFAPLTAVGYLSINHYPLAIVLNVFLFAVASVLGQVVLWRSYRPLIARRGVHRQLAWTWLGLYGFVGIQMAWTLRPFIGAPGRPTRFFREGAWGNAYLELANIVRSAFGV